MSLILIIEDEAVIRGALRRLLERAGHQVSEAASVGEVQDRYDATGFDLIIADLRLPGRPGTDIIQVAPATPVLIMTSYASVRSAVESMKLGATDYVAKPFDHDELLVAVDKALKQSRLVRQNVALKCDLQREYPVCGMVGRSAPMQEVFRRIEKVAPMDTTVLILGESGTGKELVARAVHERSQRRDGPLVAVNCAAIAENLIESELFGHEKGAFTGATAAHRGMVEAANGGTLFLDEIGELPLPAQARLLRVLQDGEIRRVGACQLRKVNIRLLAATHRDLKQLCQQDGFRSDLYFRLRVMEIPIAPLRERGDDILLLAEFLLEKICKRLNRHGLRFGPETLEAIRNYPWPGNVRELENAIERAVILCESGAISPELLAIEPLGERNTKTGEATAELSLEEYFARFVLSNQALMTETELARRLGISRKALWERRQRLGIRRPGRPPAPV